MSTGIFRPIVPNQAVATLLLIENSRSMANVWADLRDHYLQRLVETLEMSYPPVPTTMFVLPSLPPIDDESFCSAVPHQSNGLHDGLRDFRFNYDANNKLTPARISNCIDFLASTKFQGQSAALHLVIVAASAPSEDATGLDCSLVPRDGLSVWNLLSDKLTQTDILCHIVLASSHDNDMRSLSSLFEESMHLQKNVEVAPWFPINQNSYIIRLSSRPDQQSTYYPHPGVSSSLNIPHSQGHIAGVTVGSNSATTLPRNHTFLPDSINATTMMYPPDNHHQHIMPSPSVAAPSLASASAVKPDPSPPPSLVSQLQQAHGLTKKKVYGAKPTRQPFFRDERPPAQLPAPLPLTLPVTSFANGSDASPPAIASAPQQRDGRVPSHSRVDRLMRLSQGSGSSPTTDHHHHHPRLQQSQTQQLQSSRTWSRRGSRLSSPEGDALPSPGSLSSLSEMSSSTGTSYFSSSGLSSPVSPVCETMDDGYVVVSRAGMSGVGSVGTPGGIMPSDGGVIPEPPWLQQQYVTHESGGFLKHRQARMDSASQFMAQQSLYPNSPMSIQPMPSFHNYAGNLAMSVPTPVSPSCEPVKTYPPPSTPPSSFQSAHKSTPTPPKSKTKAKPAATPSTPLDLSLDSLPPLSPEDGDKPFFIFEQQEPPPEVAPPRGSFGRTVATAVPNATITSMDSAPALFNPSLPSPVIQQRSQPPRSIHSSSASIHSFSAGFQRLPYATPPYTSPAASPQATFFDQAGYFDYPHSHQSYVSDHMTRDMPSFSRPITTSTSSLTGWAG